MKSDVVIIGSGLAGLMASLAAREAGCEVLLINKTPVGSASNTLLSGAGFRGQVDGFSEEQHYIASLESGKGLCNEELLQILVKESSSKILKLRSYGVNIQERSRGFYCESMSHLPGAGIIKPLLEAVYSAGINMRGNFFAWDCIVKEGKVQGIWGFDRLSGEPVAINASAVILANGGAGSIYQRNNNAATITGDGYAMAFRSGIPLMDMEFVQFYPLSLLPGNRGYLDPALAEIGTLTNSKGEDIVQKYQITSRPLCINARDHLSRAMCLEVNDGMGVEGGIKLDVTKAAEEDWKDMYCKFGHGRVKHVRETLEKRYRISSDPIYVLPTCHFFMGGVVAGENGATSLPGLFVAGEVTGGLHGANRMGGNALTECLIFGERAGDGAAAYARTQKINQSVAVTVTEQSCKLLGKLEEFCKGNSKEAFPRELKQILKKEMWEKVGVLREEKKLYEALDTISTLFLNYTMKTENFRKDLFSCLEVLNMQLVCEMVTLSAIWRKESRGAHYRIDFPEMDNTVWLKHAVIKNIKGKIAPIYD